MIIETGDIEWPYKIYVRLPDNMKLRNANIYDNHTIKHWNERYDESIVTRWKYPDDRIREYEWWLYFRDEETAIRAFTALGKI